MIEHAPLTATPEAEHQHPIPPQSSAKELAARMASTTEETAHFFVGPTKDLNLKLVDEED